MTKVCSRCDQEKDLSLFAKRKRNKSGLNARCLECEKERSLRGRIRRKLEGVEAYGGCCQCCGEDNPYFLTIDHIGGRSEIDDLHGEKLWRYLKKLGWPKDNYQLLCFNCNCGKANFGICPHKLEENKYERYRNTNKNDVGDVVQVSS